MTLPKLRAGSFAYIHCGQNECGEVTLGGNPYPGTLIPCFVIKVGESGDVKVLAILPHKGLCAAREVLTLPGKVIVPTEAIREQRIGNYTLEVGQFKGEVELGVVRMKKRRTFGYFQTLIPGKYAKYA